MVPLCFSLPKDTYYCGQPGFQVDHFAQSTVSPIHLGEIMGFQKYWEEILAIAMEHFIKHMQAEFMTM